MREQTSYRTLRMEASLKPAEVLVAPQLGVMASDVEATAAAPPPVPSSTLDPVEEFSSRLDDIINTHGSVGGILDKQVTKNKTKQF